MAERNTPTMPQSLESEAALLGAIISDEKVIYEVIDAVKPEDFYSDSNRLIYETCIDLFTEGVGIDLFTVSEKLDKKNILDKIGGYGYLTSLVDSIYIVSNAATYADIVAEKAMLRRLISAGRSIVDVAFKDEKTLGETLEYAENSILNVTQKSNTKGYSKLSEVNEKVYLELEENAGKGGMTGIPTGFTDLDKYLSGMKKGDMIVVGARPGMGKTAFMLEIAHYVATKKKLPVAVFNLEMTEEQLATRILSSHSRVSNEKLKRAELTHNDWLDLAEALADLSDAPIYIDDTSEYGIQSIKAKCRKLKMEKDIKLIIIDYLQLLTSGNKRSEANRVVEVSDISRQIKMMARELEVPIIVGSQLSREVDRREDKRPRNSDLRESGGIEQDADVVLFLYREVEYNKDTEFKNVAEVIIGKQRNGMQGTVKLYFDADHTTFRNMAKS